MKFQNQALKYQLNSIYKDDLEKSPSNLKKSKILKSKLKSDRTTRIEENDILNSITNDKSKKKTEKKQEKTIGEVLTD